MTMAFLPATFFAALFSVPSLDWRPDPGGGVIQPNFWIYWAFTLPATAIVFGLWFLLDNTGRDRDDTDGSVAAEDGPRDDERPLSKNSKFE